MIKAVIFDMDGTLVDTEPIYHGCKKALYKRLDVQIDDKFHESFVCIDSKKKWSIVKELGNLSQSIEDLISLSKSYKMEALSNTIVPVFSGILDLIKELTERKIKIAIASSSNWNIINQNLMKTGLNNYFDLKVSGEDIENGKPAPDIFLAAAKLINCNPEECLVLEDSKNGVLGTLAASMISVGHKDANSRQDLSKRHLVIDCYSDNNRSLIFDLIDNGS